MMEDAKKLGSLGSRSLFEFRVQGFKYEVQDVYELLVLPTAKIYRSQLWDRSKGVRQIQY